MKFRRAPPLPPPPGLATCTLLLDMLAADPDARPTAKQLEARVCCALEEDSHWLKAGWRCHNGWDHYGPTLVTSTTHPDDHTSSVCKLQPLYRSCSQGHRTRMIILNFRCYFCHINKLQSQREERLIQRSGGTSPHCVWCKYHAGATLWMLDIKEWILLCINGCCSDLWLHNITIFFVAIAWTWCWSLAENMQLVINLFLLAMFVFLIIFHVIFVWFSAFFN